MLNKILLVVVGAVAYVLGAKAGRERYEQIKDQAMRLWQDPQVREKAADAADVVKDKAPEAKDRLADGAKRAADKVRPDHGTGSAQPADDHVTGSSTDLSDGGPSYGRRA